MFKEVEESMSVLRRDVENVKKKTQIKLIEMKDIMSEMKNTLDGRNSRLDIAEVEISEFKYTTIETISIETEKTKTEKN